MVVFVDSQYPTLGNRRIQKLGQNCNIGVGAIQDKQNR